MIAVNSNPGRPMRGDMPRLTRESLASVYYVLAKGPLEPSSRYRSQCLDMVIGWFERCFMRSVAGRFVLASLLLGAPCAEAGYCTVDGPQPRLDSQPIEWKFTIASGESCIRGLRSGAMQLDSVSISTPAKAGQATVQGYSFSYKAPQGFKGEDTFSVTMTGANYRIRGSSIIQVHVSVR